jgi:hypothetical protein
MLKRKWKVLKVTPAKHGGGYLNMDTDIFDFTNLSDNSEDSQTRQWVEKSANGQIIKTKNSHLYWKVAIITEDQLKIELHRSDTIENKDILMFTFDCEALKNRKE